MGYAIMPLDFVVIADALRLPDGYSLLACQCDMERKVLTFLVSSEQLEGELDAPSYPTLSLHCRVEYCPGNHDEPDPRYRNIIVTPKVKI